VILVGSFSFGFTSESVQLPLLKIAKTPHDAFLHDLADLKAETTKLKLNRIVLSKKKILQRAAGLKERTGQALVGKLYV
jgi:hypothetical protein